MANRSSGGCLSFLYVSLWKEFLHVSIFPSNVSANARFFFASSEKSRLTWQQNDTLTRTTYVCVAHANIFLFIARNMCACVHLCDSTRWT